MVQGVDQQKLAMSSGIWPLYRYDPRRVGRGEPPLHLDSGAPKTPLAEYMRNEGRFRVVEQTDPVRYARLLKSADKVMRQRYAVYQQLAGITVPLFETTAVAEPGGVK
jgi:pyruvate-ferredoxin/flavodoxin oxidoreductase